MKNLIKNEKSFLIPAVVIFGVLCLLPVFIKGDFFTTTLCLSVIWAMMGMGWNILGGYAGQVSNGHAMFYAIGAYVSACMFKWWSVTPWISMWVAAILCAIVAFILGYPLLRLRGHYFAIATMAIVECVRIIFTNWPLIGGATGLSYFNKELSPWYSLQFVDRVPLYYLLLGFLLVYVIITRVVEKSKFGYYLRAIKANQDSAESAGVNSTLYKRLAYMLSAAMVGITGAIYAQYIQYIDPLSLLPLANSMLIVLVVVMGGIGTIWGPILGAFIMTFINQYARALFNQMTGLNMFIYGVLVVVIVLFLPKGLISLLPKSDKEKAAAKKAAKEGK